MNDTSQTASPLVKYGLFVISLLVVVRFVMAPVVKWQTETRDTLVILEKRLASAQGLESHLGHQEEALTRLRQQYDALLTRFPAENDARKLQLKVQKELEQWAKMAHLEVTSTTWQPESGDWLMKAPLRLQLSGTMDQFSHFLIKLESAENHYAIVDLQIRRDKKRKQGMVQISMLIIAYAISTAAPGGAT
ncbi:MAG: type 4a pilus biogenesis protein PilO [Magnetococcales bacterium]|nr:type 4a pilus biogenesis protein PilO [Magnetococcales bacterium]